MLGISEKIYNFVIQIKNSIMRKKTEKKPKQNPAYLLFVFGDFTELETFTEEISMQFLPIVTSPYLKFTFGEYGVVFHFRSNEVFSELKQYVDMTLDGITDQYFLVEYSKNIDIKMERKLKKDFLNIDGVVKKEENKNGTIDVEKEKRESKIDTRNFMLEFMIPIVDQNSFFNQNKNETKEVEPTVDEILDKITEKGIESLTEKEKEILGNYGKGKDGGR
jgi:hypothetical protein